MRKETKHLRKRSENYFEFQVTYATFWGDCSPTGYTNNSNEFSLDPLPTFRPAENENLRLQVVESTKQSGCAVLFEYWQAEGQAWPSGAITLQLAPTGGDQGDQSREQRGGGCGGVVARKKEKKKKKRSTITNNNNNN